MAWHCCPHCKVLSLLAECVRGKCVHGTSLACQFNIRWGWGWGWKSFNGLNRELMSFNSSWWGGAMPAKSVGCLYLFTTTLFHLHDGKCDFNQNNGSQTQSLSEIKRHDSGFGYRIFFKCNLERSNYIFLYPKPKLGQKINIGLQILSLTSLDSELFAREKKVIKKKWLHNA
jgi:hypothetical protein